MTAQMHNQFLVDGESWSLVGMRGDELFDPAMYNMDTYSTCTACWDGFLCTFEVKKEAILLQQLLINTENPVRIHDIEAQESEDSLFKYQYKDIGLILNFTGVILLGNDFIQKYYVHMGFQDPVAFKRLIKVQCTRGKVDFIKDLSVEAARLREEGMQLKSMSPRVPGATEDDDTMSWIRDTFSLDYDDTIV
ncbi:MAG: hypothetical protein INQ03_04285 [Candidatus Heimdallarchaeota archaeon]|nr:hypothetical protein [Candidatus Heimdallarchaeota archaeon]